jgi:hypothetical protein
VDDLTLPQELVNDAVVAVKSLALFDVAIIPAQGMVCNDSHGFLLPESRERKRWCAPDWFDWFMN